MCANVCVSVHVCFDVTHMGQCKCNWQRCQCTMTYFVKPFIYEKTAVSLYTNWNQKSQEIILRMLKKTYYYFGWINLRIKILFKMRWNGVWMDSMWYFNVFQFFFVLIKWLISQRAWRWKLQLNNFHNNKNNSIAFFTNSENKFFS